MCLKFISIDFNLLHPFVWWSIFLYTTHLRLVNSPVVSEKLSTSILRLVQTDTTKIERGILPRNKSDYSHIDKVPYHRRLAFHVQCL